MTDPSSQSDQTSPAWRRALENPLYMLVLAVVALAAGVTMSRNTSRAAAARAELPPRADCVRFPGACTEGLPVAPPPELAALHAEVAALDSAWRIVLEGNRRTGVFPDKALTAMRDALVASESARLDARALLAEAEAQPDAREMALEALREAYEQKRALLARAVRLFEGAV